MIIGHLPAGYLAARGASALGAPQLYWGLIAGSIAPDLDMLWFFFVDGGTVHHHTYLTHRPIMWVGVLAMGLVLRRNFLTGMGLGGLLHLALDTIVGRVMWFWPLSDTGVTLVEVPATQSHWLLSFMVHWTFAVELALVVVALTVLRRSGARP